MRVIKRAGASKGFPIVEFSGSRGTGGLIEFHEDERGNVHVTLYRLDPGVKVQVSRPGASGRSRSRGRRR